MNTKRNNGNEQQPYIPAGHGKESGQYTNKVYVDNNYDDFIIKEGCTKPELIRLLSEEEYEAIKKYSNYIFGRALNKALREQKCSYKDAVMALKIFSAIKKHQLKNSIEVYRGITVTNEVFIKDFYNKYVNNEVIPGSLICSTSRRLKRAIEGAKADEANKIGIIFVGTLPKGYNALPIEAIAKNTNEQEILLFQPIYKIKLIETGYLDHQMIKIIHIELKGVK